MDNTAYIKSVIEDYSQETFKAQPVIDEIKRRYKSLSSVASKLSTIRSKLLEKTPIKGYANAKDYLVAERKKYNVNYRSKLTPEELSKLVIASLIPNELNKLKLSPTEYANLSKKADDSLNIKHNQVIRVKEEFIQDVLKGLDSPVLSELLPALLLATGRRMVEIAKTGKFSKAVATKCITNKMSSALLNYYDNLESTNKAKFSGQVKKNGAKSSAYLIPLLAPLKKVQGALKNLRKLIPDIVYFKMDNEETHNFMSPKAQAIVSDLKHKIDGHFSLHTLRAIYAVRAYKDYKGDLSQNAFFKEVLGHNDLNTSLNYSNIILE